MKKIQFILTLFCVLALLPACNDDEQGRLTALLILKAQTIRYRSL